MKPYTKDGLEVRVNIMFDPGSEYSTIDGMAFEVKADRPRIDGIDTVEGTVERVTGAEAVIFRFPGNSFTTGKWTAQLRAIPPGTDGKTIVEYPFIVLESW